MIISQENPFRSPAVASHNRPDRYRLVLFATLVGACVGLVGFARYVYQLAAMFRRLGQRSFIDVILEGPLDAAKELAIELGWGAATGAAVGALASLILARRPESDSTNPLPKIRIS